MEKTETGLAAFPRDVGMCHLRPFSGAHSRWSRELWPGEDSLGTERPQPRAASFQMGDLLPQDLFICQHQVLQVLGWGG